MCASIMATVLDSWAAMGSDIKEGGPLWEEGGDMKAIKDMALPDAFAFAGPNEATLNSGGD